MHLAMMQPLRSTSVSNTSQGPQSLNFFAGGHLFWPNPLLSHIAFANTLLGAQTPEGHPQGSTPMTNPGLQLVIGILAHFLTQRATTQPQKSTYVSNT